MRQGFIRPMTRRTMRLWMRLDRDIRGRERAMRSMHEPDAQGFIPGVYNYCDRRCERCRFVRQCRVGVLDVDDVGEAEDAVAAERPEDLRTRLEKLMGIPRPEGGGEGAGKDDAEDEEGDDDPSFDPGEMEPDPDYERRQQEIKSELKAHPLTEMGMAYAQLVGAWMRPREKALVARGIRLHRSLELGIAAALHTAENQVLGEAFEELLWFKNMLHIKCQRAVRGRMEDGDDDYPHPWQSDRNGTARLAIEIAGRCQAAWATIAQLMPEEREGIVPLQALLQRIEAALRKEFPDTDKFIRAGFDAPREPTE